MIIKGKDIRLPKRFKARWVKALRSGKYIQGKSMLYRNNTFCCLGVAGDLCKIPRSILGKYTFLDCVPNVMGYTIPILLGKPEYYDIMEKLANFNDNGKSFNWIASYIERYL